MNKIIKIGLLIIVLAAFTGGCLYNEESYTSTYEYQVTLTTSRTLENPIIYVPLPLVDGESKLGELLVSDNASAPDDLDYSIVDTQHGKMLKISASEIKPVYRQTPIPLEEDEEPTETTQITPSNKPTNETPRLATTKTITVTLNSNDTINTRNPINNEPVLQPKYNLTEVSCDYPHPEEWDDRLNCYEYDTRIYTDYTTEPDATVSIEVEMRGSNTWWSGGWNGNEYRERAHVEITGPQQGWHTIPAELVEGEGNYR